MLIGKPYAQQELMENYINVRLWMMAQTLARNRRKRDIS